MTCREWGAEGRWARFRGFSLRLRTIRANPSGSGRLAASAALATLEKQAVKVRTFPRLDPALMPVRSSRSHRELFPVEVCTGRQVWKRSS